MASNASRVMFLRSTMKTRWMSKSTAAASKAETGVTQLFRKLAAMGVGGTKVNVVEALDEWVNQGHSLRRYEILTYATQLRRWKKYDQAAELYEWVDKSDTRMNNADRAIRIDLLAKAKGVESAEKYFNSLEKSAQTKKTFGALLNCYCQHKMVEKAAELFDEMRKRDSYATALSYNNMMAMYTNVGQPEKATLLFEEMEKKNVTPDKYTYNQLMTSYAALRDYASVEGVLLKMKAKKVHCDWFTYGNLATIYVNAGLIDKANGALKTLEETMPFKDPEAFRTLINLYGRTSNALGVERSWNALRSTFPKPGNLSYLMVLLALSRLGDIDQLGKIFKHWESECLNYDVRISNVLLDSYLNRDMIDEANLLFDNIAKRNSEPNLRTYDLFMKYYLKKQEMGTAMKFLEGGAAKVGSGSGPTKIDWFPDEESINAFVRHFREEKDTDSATMFREIMEKINRLDAITENSIH